jgi:hypothetical protein
MTWLQCPNYPSYEVSDSGLVRRSESGHVLAFNIKKGSHPYRRVKLSENGKARLVLVHRLVLEAFVGPCPEGCQTLHADDDPSNNRLDNLSWGTPKKNHETINRHGFRNGRAKLSEDDVRAIRSSPLRHFELAKRYNVSSTTIENVRNRKLWRSIP